MHTHHKSYLVVLLLLFMGCNSEQNPSIEQVDYKTIPAFSENNLINAVIEIPAGTNHKIEYDAATGTFPCDQENGEDRIINFLGYPGNYGFIPSTEMSPDSGGDGDAMDILVLSESVPTGTVMEVIPIGMLMLIDNREKDYKVVAVPANKADRILQATSKQELSAELTYIIELWFLNYKGQGRMEFKGWKGPKKTKEIIRQWSQP